MIDRNKIDDDGIHQLRVAVVKQAMRDYEYALRKERAYREEEPSDPSTLERWFLSEYGQLLCAGNGERLLTDVRQKIGMPSLTYEEVQCYTKQAIRARRMRTAAARKAVPVKAEVKIERRVLDIKHEEGKKKMLMVMVEVDCPDEYGEAVKEDLAMYLERFGDTKVIRVQEVKPMQMEIGGAK